MKKSTGVIIAVLALGGIWLLAKNRAKAVVSGSTTIPAGSTPSTPTSGATTTAPNPVQALVENTGVSTQDAATLIRANEQLTSGQGLQVLQSLTPQQTQEMATYLPGSYTAAVYQAVQTQVGQAGMQTGQTYLNANPDFEPNVPFAQRVADLYNQGLIS